VKAALVQSFQVDEARLASQGFGASKPAKPNTTPEGTRRQPPRRAGEALGSERAVA
jgi:outer membrane protein OmpA-like peptidoglycan-associated protein